MFVLESPLPSNHEYTNFLFCIWGTPELPREMSEAWHTCPSVNSTGWLSSGSVNGHIFHIMNRLAESGVIGEEREAEMSCDHLLTSFSPFNDIFQAFLRQI